MSQLALEIGGFVLGDGLLGSETVKHCTYLAECCFSLSLVSHFAKIADGVAGSLCIVTVAKST